MSELNEFLELPASLALRYCPALLDGFAEAKRLSESELPRLARQARPTKDRGFDARLEHLKAARNRIALELGLDRGGLCGRTTLEAVARARPTSGDALAQITELVRWQVDVRGQSVLEALR